MAAWREFAQIGKFQIERKHHPALLPTDRADLLIGLSNQPLFEDGGSIVTGLDQGSLQIAGQIFIDLDFHEAVIFQTFSRANSAA